MVKINFLNKIFSAIKRKRALQSSDKYIEYLRSMGAKIGQGTVIRQKTCTIDLTRPSMVSIGDNVMINEHFTLLTHDFVSGIFREVYHDFLPSSGAVNIGNNVRFGFNVTILKGVTIGDNCFIGAGSVVSNDIPTNSVASGNPCKVICNIESFYKMRQVACKPEAYLYAQSIVKRLHRQPVPADFWEEFPLFVDSSNIDSYPEIPIKRQLQGAYETWLKNHIAPYKSFDEFLEGALAYKPSTKSQTVDCNAIPAAVVSFVRQIVSKCTEHDLTEADESTYMDDIEGWTSLTNMMILSEIEREYGIVISSEDMFEMTSINSIAAIVSRLTSASNKSEECFENISELYPHSPLLGGICKNVESSPAKVAIKCNGKVDTYASLYNNICKAAKVMTDLGIKHGDRVILSAHKDIEYIYLYFASHILGVTNVIIDAESNEERLNYIEQKTKPKYCFGYKSHSFSSSLFSEMDFENTDPLTQAPECSSFKETDIAEILFTTGTTGAPKGVCLTYANIYGSASNINEYIQNTSEDVELLGLPICHSFGMGRIRCNLLKGATIVIVGSFANVQKVFKTIEDEHITGFGVVPAAWAYIRKASGKRMSKFADQIKYIEIGSAAMPLETKQEMLEMFPNTRICMHYGLTEASRNCFQEFHDVDHLMTIGKPVTDKVSVKIYQNDGSEAPVGESGELCVKGNMVLAHYLEDSDTKQAFYGEYFRTGDNGFIDDEGFIHLLGREKELINVGGKKVSPMEVEDAIISLGVGDCVCVPMKDPDGVMGELVKCYVLKDSTTLSFGQIADGLQDKLEVYKRPVFYEWIDSIPQTSSGKKQRIKLDNK